MYAKHPFAVLRRFLVVSIFGLYLSASTALAAPAIDPTLLQQTPTTQQMAALSAAAKKAQPDTKTEALTPIVDSNTEIASTAKDKSAPVELSPIEESYNSRIEFAAPRKDPFLKSRQNRLDQKMTGLQNPAQSTENEIRESNKNPKQPKPAPIKQFGYDLFSKPVTSSGGRTVPADTHYILMPGDQITILIWESVEQKIDAQLDDNGNAFLPKIGQINLGGMSVGSARAFLKDAYGEFYVNFDLDITVNKVRPMTVYLVGEVTRPGAYAATRGATLFSILISSGGPTKQGSLRNIQLLRNGRVIGKLDLYSYLVKGTGLRDVTLMDQDQIFVPTIGDTALVMGNILHPAIFELLPGEALNNVADYSGGALPFTNPNHIQISRISGGQYQKILDSPGINRNNRIDTPATPLQNGDIIQFFEMPSDVKNYVEVSGNVLSPGRYAFSPNMTIRNLVDLAGGLLPDTDKNSVQVTRYISESKNELYHIDFSSASQNNYLLKDRDTIFFYSNKDFEGDPFVQIDGAILTPGKYLLEKNMHLSDLLLLAKLDPSAAIENAELYRQKKTGYPNIININVNEIQRNPASSENLLLQRDDHLFVRASHAINSQKLVELRGEFVFPGIYAARDGERLSSVIERAGGFTNSAFLPGAIFTRVSAKQGEALGQRRILDDERKQLSQDQLLLSQEVDKSAAEELLLTRRKESLSILETEIDKFSGRVLTQLDRYYEFKGSIYDVPLENGDLLNIPVFPSTVQVIGGVQNPASIIFVPGTNFDYYINQVGGYTEHAFHDGIYIIRANGSTTRDLSKVEVGDIIFVPERVRLPFDWIKLITSVTDVVFKVLLIRKELSP